jgi:hypothetical protein
VTLLEHALDAVARGLKVFPCNPRLKTPATAHGAKEMTTDEAKIRAWWAHMPDANIGCNAGVIIDIDAGIDSLEKALRAARIWKLPPTLMVRTGRRPEYGVQLHFTGDAPAQGPFEMHGCGGEIRCLRGNYYGMAPASIHPSGNVYEIVVDMPIAAYPSNSLLAPLKSSGEDHGAMTIEEIKSKMRYLFREAAHAAPGTRNDKAHRATYFAARGFLAGAFDETEDEIKLALFKVVNPLYKPGERAGGIKNMLRGSWQRGIAHGPFEVIVPYEDCTIDKDGHLQLPGEKQ